MSAAQAGVYQIIFSATGSMNLQTLSSISIIVNTATTTDLSLFQQVTSQPVAFGQNLTSRPIHGN